MAPSPGSLVRAAREDGLDQVLALHPLPLLLRQLACFAPPCWPGKQLTNNVKSKHSVIHLQREKVTRRKNATQNVMHYTVYVQPPYGVPVVPLGLAV